ncbi:rhodanese-like domain-containing protein [Pseudactinotalea sp.]|uniref:rhodanese-like domain-containing protein n=1 Tax=Pseudactinotalea sp. TaxID=1926260 RepID=UPI003B3B1438
MAVTTGTTWDIVLSNAPVSTTPRAAVSPRAAYQAALYGRAVLVDLRTARRRDRDGDLPPEVATVVVDRLELGVWLRESLASRVFLVDDDGARAGRLARGGDPRVTSVEGGFTGWLAAGLPAA